MRFSALPIGKTFVFLHRVFVKVSETQAATSRRFVVQIRPRTMVDEVQS